MGLQRTPPQRVNATGGSSQPQDMGEASLTAAGNTSGRSLPSPSRAFQPRNPGVVRSPLAGSVSAPPPPVPHTDPTPPPQLAQIASELPPLPQATEDLSAMDVDEPGQMAGPSTTPPTQPSFLPTTPGGQVSRIPGPSTTPAPPAITPAPAPPSDPTLFQTPKTPRSRRKSQAEIAQVLNQPAQPLPAVPVPHEILMEEQYGPRWRATIKAVEEATKAGAQRWTAKHVEQIFPLIATRYPDALRDTYTSSSQLFKKRILEHASHYLEHYRTGPALQLIDQVVEEGKAYASNNKSSDSRPDAWRPELSPAALTAASNLSVYDEAWDRLRTEYTELHQDCRTRYASIVTKQAALKELEEGVSDGVLELEHTLKLVDGFPDEKMTVWMEDIEGQLPGSRDP